MNKRIIQLDIILYHTIFKLINDVFRAWAMDVRPSGFSTVCCILRLANPHKKKALAMSFFALGVKTNDELAKVITNNSNNKKIALLLLLLLLLLYIYISYQLYSCIVYKVYNIL